MRPSSAVGMVHKKSSRIVGCTPCTRAVIVVVAAAACAARAPAGQSDPDAVPPLPRVALAGLAGLDEDRSYAKSVAVRAAELVEQADRTEDVATRIDLLLRAANLILANEIEPVCTTRLLRLEVSTKESQDETVLDALDRSDELLSKVGDLLNSRNEEVGEAPQADRPWAPERQLQTLQAFGAAMRAYLLVSDESEVLRASRRAASRLSVLLEDDNPQIAAAAGLWQACLRSGDADPSRALELLDPALADLPGKSLPFSFFARLLRCRLIAARGGYAAALALLTQIEDRCEDWFPDESQRNDAMRALALTEFQVLRDWHGALADPDQSEERQWCIDRAAHLATERFTEEHHSLLRLDPCVPLLPIPPDAKNRNFGTSSGDG